MGRHPGRLCRSARRRTVRAEAQPGSRLDPQDVGARRRSLTVLIHSPSCRFGWFQHRPSRLEPPAERRDILRRAINGG